MGRAARAVPNQPGADTEGSGAPDSAWTQEQWLGGRGASGACERVPESRETVPGGGGQQSGAVARTP